LLLPVAAVELGSRDALRWILGVKIEREPLDRGAEPVAEPRRPFVGDVAERSDVVAPDDDSVRLLSHGPKRIPAPRACARVSEPLRL
jgi:hypothetical protein